MKGLNNYFKTHQNTAAQIVEIIVYKAHVRLLSNPVVFEIISQKPVSYTGPGRVAEYQVTFF